MTKTRQNNLLTSLLFMAIAIVSGLATNSPASAQFFSKQTQELLPEEQAFAVTAQVTDSGLLKVNWSIADDYYMYHEQFSIESVSSEVTVGEVEYPNGVVENDPEFGEVVVYFYNAQLISPLSGSLQTNDLDLLVKGQGCNKPVGVCYPPITRKLSLNLTPAAFVAVNDRLSLGSSNSEAVAKNSNQASSKQTAAVSSKLAVRPATIESTQDKTFLTYVLSAFFAGVLLSFTPCVLPMIPILAGVIAGQEKPSRMQSGWLAVCYVAGTVVTYIAAGAIAGATGAQLQAYFQNVWVIFAICSLLLILAASLFGWFKIQLPSSIQSKLNNSQLNNKSASLSSFALGLISALVVGACVSPILILALGAAITQGDPLLGAAIMGAMATGMGLLLILFGFGAGWILPKAGVWMTQVQIIFGFMVIGVAIYLLSGLSFIPSLYLWSALLLCMGFYCWQLANDITHKLVSSCIRAISASIIIWGGMALIGGSQSGKDILRPMSTLSLGQVRSSSIADSRAELPLVTTTTLTEVQALLQSAKDEKKAVLIDFYADWCLDCKRMHRTTFKNAKVVAALKDWSFIEIDVTDTSGDSEQVKRHFKVFGPPATLFINSQGQERLDLRQYGYIKEAAFLELVSQVQ
ncbi:MAG: thiol:disulfide interchange protein DsbD [Arenicella sp.]|jgi:thiol:disulfide interchange protein DsbD